MIATFPSRHYDINLYPAVKEWLLVFAKQLLIEHGYAWIADNTDKLNDFCRQRLEQTGKNIIIDSKRIQFHNHEKSRKKTNNKWFETQDSIGYWEDFLKPKIVFQEIVQFSQFFYDDNAIFMCNDTGRIITGNKMEFLLSVFNSTLFFFAIKKFYGGGALGEKGVRMKHTFFENFPCIPYSKDVECLGKELIRNYDDDISSQLDRLIFNLYKLNDEEISFIFNDIQTDNEIEDRED